MPTRSTTRGANGATISMLTAMGMPRNPACSGLKPSTSWRYWVPMKAWPYMAKDTRVTAMLAALKRRFLKKRMSSIGCSQVSSHSTNPASTITPAARGT